jgi:hypothetical protein
VKGINNMVRPRGTDSAQLVNVIKTESLRGVGTKDDPCRIVIQYWSTDGELLAEKDTWEEEISK